MLRFNKKYFLIAVIIFIVEFFIALYVRDAIIRPFVGDILVVILIYYFLKTFIKVKAIYIAVFTLLLSFLVEVLQYFDFVDKIGLSDNKIAAVVLGTSFSWIDILCYIVGFLCLFVFDKDLRTPVKSRII